jgi:hypothetical protein
MAFYFFKFIPDNKSNLEGRSYRQLRSLANTITQKTNDIGAIFEQKNIETGNVIHKKGAFDRLNSIYAYSVDRTVPEKEKFFVGRGKNENVKFYFRIKDTLNPPYLAIRSNDLLSPVFNNRDDLFNAYILLRNNPGSDNPARTTYEILYQSPGVSSSEFISLDTLSRLQKNSDFSSTIDLNISGTDYHIFLSSFRVQQEKLVLAGLIKRADYLAKVNRAPRSLASFFFVLLLVLLISLPFFKIFLLSPREHIGFSDVIYCGISLFAGSSLLIIALFGIFTASNKTANSQNKLKTLSNNLKQDFESQLDSCKKQLQLYDQQISNIADSGKWLFLLEYRGDSMTRQNRLKLNDLMKPRAYKNIQRVFWIDSSGDTQAKWNTFNFFANFTCVSDFAYFTRLSAQSREDSSVVIYPVFSNSTGEFQVIVSRSFYPADKKIKKNPLDNLKYSLIAGFFTVSARPVMEKNFDFSIIDNSTGDVFFSSDKSQNLQLNFSDELHSSNFQNALITRTASPLPDINFKDKLLDLYVSPIKDFPLSLVVYYDKGLVYDHVLRIIYFTTEIILIVYILIIICLGWYGIKTQQGSVLNVSMNKIEWFRISKENSRSYRFTVHYFLRLIFLTLILFFTILAGNLDIRSIFYISFFLPFFTTWGFLSSRLTDSKIWEDEFRAKKLSFKIITMNYFFPAFMILLNFIVLGLIPDSDSWIFDEHHCFLYFFEVAALIMMSDVYTGVYGKNKWFDRTNNLFINRPMLSDFGVYKGTYEQLEFGKEKKKIIINYFNSLYLGVLLVAVIPVIGIFLYAENSQRIQDLKSSELFAVSQLEKKIQYVNKELIDNFDSTLEKLQPGFFAYMEDFKKNAGIYLSPGHRIFTRTDKDMNKDTCKTINFPSPDVFYYSLLHFTFPFALDQDDNDNIQAQSGDTSWTFQLCHGRQDSLFLRYKSQIDKKIPLIEMHSKMPSQLSVFAGKNIFSKLFLIALLFSLLYGCLWVIWKSIRRLFLLDYYLNRDCQRTDSCNLYYLLSTNSTTDFTINNEIDLNKIPTPVLFKFESARFFRYRAICSREEFILAMQNYFRDNYEQIWQSLDKQEQYVTYDVCTDGYTNYKDMDVVYRLIFRGILYFKDFKICPFSKSFQNYILSKKGTAEIRELKSQVAVAGTWQAFRNPVLFVVVIIASFLVITQDTLVHQATALITSVGAIFRLLSGFAVKLPFTRVPK